MNIRAEWLHFILRCLLTRNFSKFLCFAGGKSCRFESFGQRRRISFDNIQRHCGSRVGKNVCHIVILAAAGIAAAQNAERVELPKFRDVPGWFMFHVVNDPDQKILAELYAEIDIINSTEA